MGTTEFDQTNSSHPLQNPFICPLDAPKKASFVFIGICTRQMVSSKQTKITLQSICAMDEL